MKSRNRATLFLTTLLSVSFYLSSCQIDSTQEGSIAVIWVYKDGKFGYIDDIGREVIPCQFDYKSGFSEGWTALKKGNNWSYYDDRGKKVLDLSNRFTYCGQFHDGVAFVSTLPTNGISPLYAKFYENISKEIQFINRKGEVIFKVDNEWNVSHIDLMRGFSEGLLAMHKEIEPYRRLIGYLDKSGQLKIPFKFQGSNASEKFSEGLADVGVIEYRLNSKSSIPKYGFIDKTGAWKIQPIYTSASSFDNGAAFVSDTLPNTYNVIDKEGALIFPPDVKTFPPVPYHMRDSLVAVYQKKRWNDSISEFPTKRWAIAKTDGTMITDFKFADLNIGRSDGDLWKASLPENRKMIGYVDDEGEVVIPYQFFRGSSSFEDGLAVVQLHEENYPYAVINRSGKFILPPAVGQTYYQNSGLGLITSIVDSTFVLYNSHGELINTVGYLQAVSIKK